MIQKSSRAKAEVGANGASTDTTVPETTPKKPVRRRAVKKDETSEQLTLTAPPTEAAAPEKPKRTRATRTRKAEDSVEVEVQAPPAAQPPSQSDNAAGTPQISVSSETPAPLDTTPTISGKSVPARFPSRFKRQEAGTSVPSASETQPGDEASFEPQTPEFSRQDALSVAPEFVREDNAPRNENQPRFERENQDNREREGRERENRGERDGRERDNRGFRERSNRNDNFGNRGENSPGENAPQNGASPAAFDENGAATPRTGENGAFFNGENAAPSEYPDGGRMRYRDRRDRRPGRNDRDNRNERGPREGGFVPQGQQGGRFPQQPRRREYEIGALRNMAPEEILAASAEYGIEESFEEREQLVLAILEAQARTQGATLKIGILEGHENKAFLRCEGYLPSEGDVYVSPTQIKRFNLKTGDRVLGTARAPKDNERFYGLLRVEAINNLAPEELRFRKDFEKLTPIFPTERFQLEIDQTNITARIIDLISPLGKGQRGLIVAPPKAGKTTLIKNIANSIATNHPEVKLFVLLIDERPEEVTDISRSVKGEVIASTFDEMPDNHMRVADIVLERAKRLVEMKEDVVILMDSITRLSRASNLVVAPSGRTLSGGLDPAAMYRPKRMFGAARNIEEGGSLTILATALVDTGSRMDEMIFEEFKGTGNMDLVLDRNLFDQRIFPAIDINRSGTRRDDLLMEGEELAAIFHLRRTLAQLDNDKAVTLLIDRLKNTKTNTDFMQVVAKSARNAEIKNT